MNTRKNKKQRYGKKIKYTKKKRDGKVDKGNTKKLFGGATDTETKTIRYAIDKIKKTFTKGRNKKTTSGYLKKLIDKGDQPITGNDIKMFCNQITELTDILKYTPMGENLLYTGLIIKLLMGDEDELNKYIEYYELPKYFNTFPPHIDIGAIVQQLQYYPLYKNAYNTYLDTLKGKKQADDKDSTMKKLEKIVEVYNEYKAGRLM